MSLNDRESVASLDAAFERSLLKSARGDGPSDAATEAAWARFASMAAGTAASTAAARPGVLFEAARSSALKWLLLGALGGGAVIAAWMNGGPAADRAPVARGAAVSTGPSSDVAQHEQARREAPQQAEAAPSLAHRVTPAVPSRQAVEAT